MKGEKWIRKRYPNSDVLRCRAVTSAGTQCARTGDIRDNDGRWLCTPHWIRYDKGLPVEIVEVEEQYKGEVHGSNNG